MSITSSTSTGLTFTPNEVLYDPTNKLRVSTPQSLIDTDFEYGTQVSKWQNLTLVNNRPFAFSSATQIANVSSITMATNSRTVTVVLSSGVAPANGTPITVLDTFLAIANGNFLIASGGGTNTFTYTGNATNVTTLTALLDANKTVLYQGTVYTGASIGATGSATFAVATNKVTVTTAIPHGLSIGNEVAITGITGTNPPNGSFIVAQITSPTVFAYYTQAVASGLTTSSGLVYALGQGSFNHRPFDGGVIFSTNAQSNYESATRQTRRYFRYQSGKAVQVSSGTILKPNFQLDSLTSSGTTVTVRTKEKHSVLPGTSITVLGANEAAYNGTFEVTSVTGFNTFTYTALSAPSSTTASGIYYVAVSSWFGATNRLGMFDSQNGVFWEFDGQTLNAVRRNSIYQIAGRVSVTNGAATVTQTSANFPTSFSKQLTVGDRVVIRGITYRVIDIVSDTQMSITPSYRGPTITNAIVTKTQELRIPQSQFNIDKLDGTGASRYNIDLSKMQMFYIDYTWYGAGFIRWGVRGPNGNVIYCHKMANNNVNTEAYMRSGNLPARYETETNPPFTYATASIGAADATINVASTTGFPTPSVAKPGTLLIRNGSTYEYVNYTTMTGTQFGGLTRAQSGNASLALTVASGSNIATVSSAANLQIGQQLIDVTNAYLPEGTFIVGISGTTLTLSNAVTGANPTVIAVPPGASSGQIFTVSSPNTNPTSVELARPTYAPTISHWGTSVIMDGRFDDDKSLLFTYGQTSFTNIASGTNKALFSIRVAPSVDNGIPSAFGARELINRMQLVLRALDITTRTASANMLVLATLNGTPSSATTWNPINTAAGAVNSSLAQIADYAAGTTTVAGGEVTGGFFVATTGSVSLETVRDLGNSILGGGTTTANSGIYPDGPDVLTISVTNLGSAAVDVLGRLSWTEAQA
jgi:hypothetical protein